MFSVFYYDAKHRVLQLVNHNQQGLHILLPPYMDGMDIHFHCLGPHVRAAKP